MAGADELPEVGPWARDKLGRLRKYLRAYTTILTAPKQARWCKGILYVDAFAGAGQAVVRGPAPAANSAIPLFDREADPEGTAEVSEVIDGSPRVALGTDPPFTQYVFIERDAGRVAHLNALAAELGTTGRVKVVSDDCNTFLHERLVTNPPVDWSEWRAVVFLDPFGMQVPWSTISGLGGTGAIEVFINFPVGMAIQRLLKRSGSFTDKERAKLDDYFGSPEWRQQLYETQPGLFGDVEEKLAGSGNRLVTWYRDRLRAQHRVAAPGRVSLRRRVAGEREDRNVRLRVPLHAGSVGVREARRNLAEADHHGGRQGVAHHARRPGHRYVPVVMTGSGSASASRGGVPTLAPGTRVGEWQGVELLLSQLWRNSADG